MITSGSIYTGYQSANIVASSFVALSICYMQSVWWFRLLQCNFMQLYLLLNFFEVFIHFPSFMLIASIISLQEFVCICEFLY